MRVPSTAKETKTQDRRYVNKSDLQPLQASTVLAENKQQRMGHQNNANPILAL